MQGSTNKRWWLEPLRVVQTNLQVADTARIDPERLAAQVEEMGGNMLVFNTGGIYAWYDTAVPHHVRNPNLPAGSNLAGEVAAACRRRGIRFVARCDFKAAEDSVYLHKPQWFVKDRDNRPDPIAAERPGNWPLLLHTCLNSGYRREEVAIPVLREIMGRIAPDGLFVNSFFYIPCCCEACARLYRDMYGNELPVDPALYEPDWRLRCMHRGMEDVQGAVRAAHPGTPMFFYAYPFVADGRKAELLCAEPHNMMTLGRKNMSQAWKPAINMKWARSTGAAARPLAIVHSSPGLNWRHTGIQPAEYDFWLSQAAAHGGQLWHSLTGVPDTIGDRNIIEAVRSANRKAKSIEPFIHGAKPAAQIALLWSELKPAELWHAGDGAFKDGWIEGLMANQLPFELLHVRDASDERLRSYELLIAPADVVYTEQLVAELETYVEAGGSLLVEGKLPETGGRLHSLLGVRPETYESPELFASYMRIGKEPGNPLRRGIKRSDLVPHQGRVQYCEPLPDALVPATLVPPFSPMSGVGNPPERASLPAPETAIPLCVAAVRGAGRTMYLPFAFSELLEQFRLEEYYRLAGNLVDALLPDGRFIAVNHSLPLPGVQLSAFERDESMLIQLVNGIGARPLVVCHPVTGLRIVLRPGAGRRVREVRSVFDGRSLPFDVVGDKVELTLERLDVWEALALVYDNDV